MSMKTRTPRIAESVSVSINGERVELLCQVERDSFILSADGVGAGRLATVLWKAALHLRARAQAPKPKRRKQKRSQT